jgi:hypothetical protein
MFSGGNRPSPLLPILPKLIHSVSPLFNSEEIKSNLHSISIRGTILPLLVIRRDPQHVVAADQDLTEHALVLAVDPLDSAAELNVHVAVDADQAAGVLGLAPLEADAHVGVDERLQHWPRVHGDELLKRRFSTTSEGKLGGIGRETYAHLCGFLCLLLLRFVLRSAIRSC